jgi:predicted AAA+ superfamily ATPase
MFINRLLINEILTKLSAERSKIIVIYGPRQVGKTTLANDVLRLMNKKTMFIDCDSFKYNDVLSSRDIDKLAGLVKGVEVLCIDEAQRVENIGINLKILHDHFKDLKIIVTGSSALDLANSIKEPLTGRAYTYKLYPISTLELSQKYNPFELGAQLEQRLIFGSYPEVFSIENTFDKAKYLIELSTNYLYKDILEYQAIRHSNKLRDLLKLLAFQVGSEVSYTELATSLGMAKQTVEHYIDLLEKSFVIFTLRGFSRNLRKEVSKKPKIYFYDLGIRNAIIDNFAYLNNRNDIGALWENFLIMERLKRNEYQKHYCSQYFWRTYTGAALDYIEEYNGKLYGYELKWIKTAKAPASWTETYESEYSCVNKDNFIDFVC